MGGGRNGQKRGRTQRRHFKQGRENVWKHDSKKSRTDDDSNPNPNPNPNSNPNPNWEPFATQNPGFEEYYKEQGIVPKDEWDKFISLLRKPLPAAFRINSSGQFFHDIRLQLENEFATSLGTEANNENEIEAIRPLPWYPENLAWHLNFSRMQLRKNQTLERFHEFLKHENEVGNITRQEAVSMVPSLFLDVLPDHYVLDMCAAPGSKTFQLLEIIHQSANPGLLPNGLVIANDVDVQRCNLLIHQTKRMCTANLIVTNHEAQHFPSCCLTRGCSNIPKEEGDLWRQGLQFDRVLCDVPCSGDGTLRKAPDIWRKWNAGMGNGIHRLQVEIAMRGLTLLKEGGRMVYSTCSMNPVENEAVVAEVLRRSKGSVELLDVTNELPQLIRRPGLKTWKVRDKGLWLASYNDVPKYRRNVITMSMFPSDQGRNEDQSSCDSMQEHVETLDSSTNGKSNPILAMNLESISGVEHENSSVKLENDGTLEGVGKATGEVEENANKSCSPIDANDESEVQFSSFPLERCIRILPHDQNTGAFFIAVLQKLSSCQGNMRKKLEDGQQSEIGSSENVLHHQNTEAEIASYASLMDEQLSVMSTEDCVALDSEAVPPKDNEMEAMEASCNGESGQGGSKGTKKNLQTQGKWRGVDPVVFFRDDETINSIRSFYGISESFPLDGHLVTRNDDTNHVKRIYYVSKSVHDILQLNFQVGQRLKIASLGLKIFERQSSKDSSSQCGFRLSSEGLPLLLPYISKQILFASLTDFRHLLQYRTIKFPDLVNPEFRDKASNLMPGCCVVVLNEGKQDKDSILVDPSTIAIVCWKGKTNLSIMVSQVDGQELLERLSARFGDVRRALPEVDSVEDLTDHVPGEGSEADHEIEMVVEQTS